MLSTANFSNALLTKLQAKEFKGDQLTTLCDGIANGSIPYVKTLAIATVDTGLITGIGTGTSAGGITGLNKSVGAALIRSKCVGSFKQEGKSLPDFAEALLDALELAMQDAQITTTHPLVFQGTGVVTPGTILAVGDVWGAQIVAATSFKGPDWQPIGMAIGHGFAASFLTATANVTITGVFAGAVPPGPLPGVGAGSGTIN
jgi:hypothetical protein